MRELSCDPYLRSLDPTGMPWPNGEAEDDWSSTTPDTIPAETHRPQTIRPLRQQSQWRRQNP